MHHDQHVKRTLRLYGRRADAIHLFLDQFWDKYRISHRRLLHHQLGIELIIRLFGEEASGPAKLHIIDDLGCVPGTWLDHDPRVVYLEPGDDARQEQDLILLYGRETYDRVRQIKP
jgi:hypothetical protein